MHAVTNCIYDHFSAKIPPTWPLSEGFCVLDLTAMNERNDMEEENVSISKREEDED